MRQSYVIYDGTCGFCNKTVLFFAKRDQNDHFKFVSGLSNFGKELLHIHNLKGLESSTLILVEDNRRVFVRSVAIRKILLKLPGYSFIASILCLFPKGILDAVYRTISKHRKRLKNRVCELPEQEIKEKFIV